MITLSHYLFERRHVHLVAAEHVMRYLKGMIDLGLYYGRDHDYILYGYTDLDWEGSTTDKKSTSSGFYCMGSAMISFIHLYILCIVPRCLFWEVFVM